jgi:hypothetical protein
MIEFITKTSPDSTGWQKRLVLLCIGAGPDYKIRPDCIDA